MNCKPGDLAIIVKSFAGNEGKIVRCIRLVNLPWSEPDGSKSEEASWETDTELVGWGGGASSREICDSQLRPIRPQPDDAQDETLTWLDVPSEVTA